MLPRRSSGCWTLNDRAGANAVGPKSYHFVIGSSTPAALAADMLATAYEAIPYTWFLSPTGVEMETQALALAERDFRTARELARNHGDRRHDGQLRMPRGGSTVVGRTTRCRRVGDGNVRAAARCQC